MLTDTLPASAAATPDKVILLELIVVTAVVSKTLLLAVKPDVTVTIAEVILALRFDGWVSE